MPNVSSISYAVVFVLVHSSASLTKLPNLISHIIKIINVMIPSIEPYMSFVLHVIFVSL